MIYITIYHIIINHIPNHTMSHIIYYHITRKTVAKADEEFDSAVSGIVDLPVICLDALLPNQTLIGSTTDPTFCNMLRTIGLGGIFVMTSLNNRQRRIRRFGVIARIELVDVDGDDNDVNTNDDVPEQYKHLSTPTQVSFSIVGKRRCEILGKGNDMKERIGRWRRGYDPDGEQVRLGWGIESFVDKRGEEEDNDEVESITSVNTTSDSLDNTKWNTNKVLIIDESYEEDDQADAIAKATYLVPLIESWLDLARNETTYNNIDVVARTRRKSGEPGLSVNAAALIKKVLQEIGPMPSPSQPTLFAIWGAALINPLPALGVSTEIRGAVLEAPGAGRKLAVLERGLIKSINNLDGTRPLNM